MSEEVSQEISKIEFRAMGSHMLAAVVSKEAEALSLLNQVPAWFEQWEQALSRFRESSELSVLNRAGGSPPVEVSDTLWEVLQLALSAANATGGLVTPTVLDALEAAGYNASFDTMKQQAGGELTGASIRAESEARHAANRWQAIKTVPATHAVLLPPGMRLDFGGIAKGWAADRAASMLAKYGPALVDAGGDIAADAPANSHYEWPIGVDAPTFPPFETGTQLELLSVSTGGVATSGRDYRRWQQDGEWRHHIIDPRTGSPAVTDAVAATVVAPTAREAEIAAKAVLVLGSAEGIQWIEARPALSGLLVLESGEIIQSTRFKKHLWSSRHAN